MLRDRRQQRKGDFSRIATDHEARLKKLESIEKGIIHHQFTTLPGLRGFWPMSSVDENGDAYDLSEQDRVLTYTGNPTYTYDGIAPYLDFDGIGDYLARLDEAGLDITGTETYIASAARGLTLGGWFWCDRDNLNEALITKWQASEGPDDFAYALIRPINGRLIFEISVDGTAFTIVQDGTIAPSGEWFFAVGRFDPSTSLDVFWKNRETSNVAAIPASIFNSAANFNIASIADGGMPLDGKASMCFLCAAYLSDEIISSLYMQSRPLFDV